MTAKAAIIFGASGGIGQACVDILLEKNIMVLCCDITQGAREYKDEAKFIKCDMTKTEDIKGAFDVCQKEYGVSPSYVINCAGIIDEFNWEQCVDVNLNGSIRVMLTTIEKLGKHCGGAGGALVMFGSILSLEAGPNVPVYTATKHGILGMMRAWMNPVQFADHGVRMRCVCPTAVRTNLLEYSLNGKMYKPEIMAEMYRNLDQPGSILSPVDVATEVVTFLLDEEAANGVTRMSKNRGCEEVEFEQQPFV